MKLSILLLLAGVGWWWTGASSDELVVYPATCTNRVQVLPRTLVMGRERNSFDEEKFQADRANCKILHWSPELYKLNRAKGEVYYLGTFDAPQRLIDCSIFSRTDWSCSYPDGSGKVVIIDGLEAMHANEVRPLPAAMRFSLRRWQWWTVVLLWWIGEPQGAWLIPEQHEYL